MGTWSTDSFGNDAASDWVEALSAHPSLERLARAFQSPPGTEDEVALVAAEVVAALRGHPADNFPASLGGWVFRNHPRLDAAVVEQARARVTAVGEGGELAASWNDAGDGTTWRQGVDQLLRRLTLPGRPVSRPPPRTRIRIDWVSPHRPDGVRLDLGSVVPVGDGHVSVYLASGVGHAELARVGALLRNNPTLPVHFNDLRLGKSARPWPSDFLSGFGLAQAVALRFDSGFPPELDLSPLTEVVNLELTSLWHELPPGLVDQAARLPRVEHIRVEAPAVDLSALSAAGIQVVQVLRKRP